MSSNTKLDRFQREAVRFERTRCLMLCQFSVQPIEIELKVDFIAGFQHFISLPAKAFLLKPRSYGTRAS